VFIRWKTAYDAPPAQATNATTAMTIPAITPAVKTPTVMIIGLKSEQTAGFWTQTPFVASHAYVEQSAPVVDKLEVSTEALTVQFELELHKCELCEQP